MNNHRSLQSALADDSLVIQYQTIGQYRSALLAAFPPDLPALSDLTTYRIRVDLHELFSYEGNAAHCKFGVTLVSSTGADAATAEAVFNGKTSNSTFVSWVNLKPTPSASWEATSAARDVLAERRRQIDEEGYEHKHDDEHVSGEIAAYAAFFAMPPAARKWPATETGYGSTFGTAIVPDGWAIPDEGDRRHELLKAGALILAEIERIDRADLRCQPHQVAE